MKKIALSSMPQLLDALNRVRRLYLAADDGSGQARFLPYTEGMTLTDRPNTVRSAKDLFFPQVENLMKFKVNGKQLEILDARDPVEPFVIFGVRACDCRSFELLDNVFLHTEPVDTFYRARRENGLVMTLACNAPEETCFCTAFGIDPAEPLGDVSMWETENSLYLRGNTERGTELLEALPLEDARQEEIAATQSSIREIAERLPFGKLDLNGFDGAHMLQKFKDPRWAELSESCIGCGTCTFVCPTCQCYDVREFNTGSEVQRFRCWDSCMYSDFTQMSAGQPRPTQMERFRQRFMHKLVYYPANNGGAYSCVGCGRCLQRCPIHMNIVKVVKTLGGEAHDA